MCSRADVDFVLAVLNHASNEIFEPLTFGPALDLREHEMINVNQKAMVRGAWFVENGV